MAFTYTEITMAGIVDRLQAIEDELRTANLLAYAAALQTQRQQSELTDVEGVEDSYATEVISLLDNVGARLRE